MILARLLGYGTYLDMLIADRTETLSGFRKAVAN